MLASTSRAARPKLSLAVPTTANSSAAAKTPSLSLAIPQMGKSPRFAPARSPLPPPSNATSKTKRSKRVAFSDATDIKCVTPLPDECYGAFVKMSREDRKWARAAAAYE